MRKIITAIAAISALVLGGSSAAAASFSSTPAITVTVDTSACGQVTITASGYGLTTDSAFQIVSGRASKTVAVTRTNPALPPTITATFTTKDIGENGNASIRTRFGGYVASIAQYAPGSPFVASELLAFHAC